MWIYFEALSTPATKYTCCVENIHYYKIYAFICIWILSTLDPWKLSKRQLESKLFPIISRLVTIFMFTFPETNSKSPWKQAFCILLPQKGNDRIPTIHFQVFLLLVYLRVQYYRWWFQRFFYFHPEKKGGRFPIWLAQPRSMGPWELQVHHVADRWDFWRRVSFSPSGDISHTHTVLSRDPFLNTNPKRWR